MAPPNFHHVARSHSWFATNSARPLLGFAWWRTLVQARIVCTEHDECQVQPDEGPRRNRLRPYALARARCNPTELGGRAQSSHAPHGPGGRGVGAWPILAPSKIGKANMVLERGPLLVIQAGDIGADRSLPTEIWLPVIG